MIRSKIQNPTIYHLSSIIYLSIIYLSIIYHLNLNLKLKISRLLSKILALGSTKKSLHLLQRQGKPKLTSFPDFTFYAYPSAMVFDDLCTDIKP